MILVTGATGHIGNVLVRELLARGSQVRVLLLPGEDQDPLKGFEIEAVHGNVLDLDSLRQAMRGVEVVYHLAGIISILPGKDDLVHRVNVLGTQNVLQAARENGIRRLVYTSSIHAISRTAKGVTIDEQIPFDPDTAISAYDRSKAEASLLVLDAAQKDLDAVIVCPTGVVGPYDYRLSEMGSLILDAVRMRVHFSVPGAYDFVDVRDVVQGLIAACEQGRRAEHYILAGEQITVAKLYRTVRDITGLNALHIEVPQWIAQTSAVIAEPFYRLTKLKPRLTAYALETLASNSVISYAKAARELGYQPRKLRESIADTIAWLRQVHALRPTLRIGRLP